MLKSKFVSLFVIVILLCAGSVMAKDWQDLDPRGFFNLDEFEELTDTEVTEFNQAPMLDEMVASGELAPVEERLPENPLVLTPWQEIGEYGGTIRWSWNAIDNDPTLYFLNEIELLNLASPSEISWGMGPWLGDTQPGILESMESNDEKTVYTLKLREGVKWSDGVELTTEDVEFHIREVLLNEEITPTPPEWLIYGSEKGEAVTELEIVDDYTFKLKFAKSHPTFYHLFRSHPTNSWSLFMRPKHYLQQFHKNYASWDELMPMMEDEGFESKEDWGSFYADRFEAAVTSSGSLLLGDDALDYPTLSPYVVTEVKSSGDMVYERNPYFAMVDPAGNQLPYIDRLYRKYVEDAEMINMDIIAGNTDIQRDLNIQDYPLYAKNKENGNYQLAPVSVRDNIQYVIWFVNMAYQDEEIRNITEKLDFRKALSHAIDREQIKKTLFMGFGRAAQFGAIPGTPYYEEGMEDAYAAYDPEKAKSLLDGLGVVDTDGDGWRNLPDSSDNFILRFELCDIGAPTISASEMAKRYWEDIGLKTEVKQVSISYWFEMHGANQVMVSSWWGHGMDPTDVWHLGLQMSTPEWRKWNNSGGDIGIEPPAWAKRMLKAQEDFEAALTKEEAMEAGKEMWKIQAEYIPIIGSVAEPRIPFVYSNDLGNIGQPEEIMDYAQKVIMGAYPAWYFTSEERRNEQ